MASNEDKRTVTTEQDNTKDSKSTKVPLENPFIAFRRFADETIGGALQSLIGLPSAVTKQLEGALPNLEKIRNDTARLRREEAESLQNKIERKRQLFLQKLETQSEAAENRVDGARHDEESLTDYLERRREEHRKKWEHIREAIQQGPDAAYTPREMDSGKGDTNGGRGFNRPPVSRDPLQNSMDLFSVGMPTPNNLGPFGALISSRLNTIMSPEGFGPYLMFSPYSPLLLSNRVFGPVFANSALFARSDARVEDSFPYCDAFEDLLLASRGMEMVPLEERRRTHNALSQYPPVHPLDIRSRLTTGASWILRLQQKGLLEAPEGGPAPEHERTEDDDGTELGMYSRFLSSAFPKAAAQIPEGQDEASQGTVTKPKEAEQQRTPYGSRLLSTLTQTETSCLPDGRVETKVVIIKKFADGKETRTETVHTNHEGTKDRGRLNDGKQASKDEKKGWFWN